jgi:hypothetical protein
MIFAFPVTLGFPRYLIAIGCLQCWRFKKKYVKLRMPLISRIFSVLVLCRSLPWISKAICYWEMDTFFAGLRFLFAIRLHSSVEVKCIMKPKDCNLGIFF